MVLLSDERKIFLLIYDDLLERMKMFCTFAAMRRYLFLLTLFVLLPFNSFAQEPLVQSNLSYRRYTTNDGLPHMQAETFYQDLDPNVFLRIDRKTIINLKRVYKINSKRRQCTLKAEDGSELILDISKSGTETLLNNI